MAGVLHPPGNNAPKPAGRLDAQQSQQHLLEHREDAGILADAEGEGEDRARRKNRRLRQGSQRVANHNSGTVYEFPN